MRRVSLWEVLLAVSAVDAVVQSVCPPVQLQTVPHISLRLLRHGLLVVIQRRDELLRRRCPCGAVNRVPRWPGPGLGAALQHSRLSVLILDLFVVFVDGRGNRSGLGR